MTWEIDFCSVTIVCELTIVCLNDHESLVIDSEFNEALTIIRRRK